MSEKLQRISIGFQGGQVLAARVTADQIKRLRSALPAGGWHDLETEDGTVALHLGQVVYVHENADDQRVGFGV
jgi:hypothetical protein